MNKVFLIHEIKRLNGDIFKGISNRYKRMHVDITPMHARILMTIYKSKTPICQKDLEGPVACNKSTLSSIISTMEKNDLIVREVSKTDSRVNYLLLTEKGEDMVRFLRKDREVTEVALTENITEEEYQMFIQLGEKIRKNIERI